MVCQLDAPLIRKSVNLSTQYSLSALGPLDYKDVSVRKVTGRAERNFSFKFGMVSFRIFELPTIWRLCLTIFKENFRGYSSEFCRGGGVSSCCPNFASMSNQKTSFLIFLFRSGSLLVNTLKPRHNNIPISP